jgi:hypothetical protein
MRLPRRPYEYAQWKKAKVAFDYHVACDKAHFYSVPYRSELYDVFAVAIKETVGFQQLQKCAGTKSHKGRSPTGILWRSSRLLAQSSERKKSV